MKIKVKDLLHHIGGNTKVIIGDWSDDKFNEIWRGKVDCLDWNNIPCAEKSVDHISVVKNEDWLQIWV